VYGWGYRSYGQLGDAVDSLVLYTPSPVMVMDLTGVAAISAGGFYSMALKTDGTVWTWGSNSHGELGNGSPVGVYKSFIPVQVNDLSGVLSIAAGFQHGLAMTTGRYFACVGERPFRFVGRRELRRGQQCSCASVRPLRT
jgi:hypothetical protein